MNIGSRGSEAGVQSVKFYNIWEGVLLSENLGWGSGGHGREQRFQRSGFCFAGRRNIRSMILCLQMFCATLIMENDSGAQIHVSLAKTIDPDLFETSLL